MRLSWPSIFSHEYRYRAQTQLAPESNTFSQDRASVSGFITPRKVNEGVKAISRGPSPFLRPLPSFAQGFFTRARKLIYSHQQYWQMRNVKRCDVFIRGKSLRYESIILSVDERIMALKIRVAVTLFRCLFSRWCGVAVFRIPPCPPLQACGLSKTRLDV